MSLELKILRLLLSILFHQVLVLDIHLIETQIIVRPHLLKFRSHILNDRIFLKSHGLKLKIKTFKVSIVLIVNFPDFIFVIKSHLSVLVPELLDLSKIVGFFLIQFILKSTKIKGKFIFSILESFQIPIVQFFKFFAVPLIFVLKFFSESYAEILHFSILRFSFLMMPLLCASLLLLILIFTITHCFLKLSDYFIFCNYILVMLLIAGIKCIKMLLLLLSKLAMKILNFLLQLVTVLNKFVFKDFMVLSVLFNFLCCLSDSHTQQLTLVLSFADHSQVLGFVLFQVVKYFKLFIQTNQHV